LGALIGGLLGAGGGYLVGANVDKITGKDKESAQRASTEAQRNPATAEAARTATTADLNTDGFVTMDELVAMEKAGLQDEEILRRLRASNQVFELTSQQRQFLLNNGLSRNVVDQLETLNREQREQVLQSSTRDDVIGRPQ
jgi:hypothetical protein